MPARTSPTLLPPSPRTVLSLSCFKVSQCINCRAGTVRVKGEKSMWVFVWSAQSMSSLRSVINLEGLVHAILTSIQLVHVEERAAAKAYSSSLTHVT